MAFLSDLESPAADGLPNLRAELALQLALAERQIASDPDGASLILDGAIWEIAAACYLARHDVWPSRQHVLSRLDADDPAFARRVRLALRAPDVRARLVHANQLYALLIEFESAGEQPFSALEAANSRSWE